MRLLSVCAGLILGACTPLSAISAQADNSLVRLEKCCIQKLEDGRPVDSCDAAFEQHRVFVNEWERAHIDDSRFQIVQSELSYFNDLVDIACKES